VSGDAPEDGDLDPLIAHVASIEAREHERLKNYGQEQYLVTLWRGFMGPPVNPLYAWDAIRYCAASSLSLPPWVAKYLAVSAQNLLAAKGNAEIPRALGFPASKGLESAFSALERARAREPACIEFAARVLAGDTVEASLAKGAEVAGRIGADAMKLWADGFFSERAPGETWKGYFAACIDMTNPRYDPLLAAMVGTVTK
jgi:hypothetical protein